MTQFESQQPNYEQQPKKKGWFGRNWLWFVPTIILLPLLCCCGGGGALVWFGIGQMFEMPPYQDTVTELRADPDIVAALGSPIDVPDGFGDLVSLMQSGGKFDMQQSGSQIDFDAEFGATGPSGTATVYIQANSTDGGATWNYTIREVQIDATGDIIDLRPTLLDDAAGLIDNAVDALDRTIGGEGDSSTP